ncbi:hypothetical protein CBM2633_A10397 [Cupriavidus taiwanensis]|nr:hypothetical protein CBM2604_A30059 [Cupriavidus taiwanensis]SOZ26568.1 hypothetical protein CBM2609_A30059 [Cupriavidus taiwanensis]SOZ45357.1 hypothetical protein CBM2610_A30061 [Cupriavidus taiwanensis]SPA10936.1 hypothetical protein CBM2633_A10397 [Cupriavidus taiwanensis]
MRQRVQAHSLIVESHASCQYRQAADSAVSQVLQRLPRATQALRSARNGLMCWREARPGNRRRVDPWQSM